MMNTKVAYLVVICAVLAAVVEGEAEVAGSAAVMNCNPVQLSPCAAAISSSGNPSGQCCAKIKQQRPCLCQYMKNPFLQKLINSPGAKKVAASCGTPFPTC
ncbi:hypothetical protein ABFS83_05G037100 [Erythranthe nasuta]